MPFLKIPYDNMVSNNISLVGFMGSGKSTIGKILAKKIGFLFVDTDRIIEYVFGKNINQIFESYNETGFRKIEAYVIKKVYENNKDCVFACGGGVFTKKENITIIRKKSLVIYLKIDPKIAFERLKNSSDRPLLSNAKDLKHTIDYLIKKRDIIYLKNSDICINVDEKEPEYFADEILKKISK